MGEWVGGTIAPGALIPASVLQSLMAELATIASPAARVAAAAATQSSGEPPAAEQLPPPPPAAAAAALKRVVDRVVEDEEVGNTMGLCEFKKEAAREGAVSAPGDPDMTTVAIKPEG